MRFTLLNNPSEWTLPFPKIDIGVTCFWRIWRGDLMPNFPLSLEKIFSVGNLETHTSLNILYLLNQSDAQTEYGHAMMKSDTFHSLPNLSHAVRGCHNNCPQLRTNSQLARVRNACVVGQTVEQTLTVRDHSDGQVLLLPFVRQNSSSHQYLTQYCSRVFCQVKSVSTGTDFGSERKQDGSFRSLALPGYERDWNDFTY